jgi:hypothetical protein
MRAVVALYGYLGLATQPEDWGASALVDTPGEILLYL